MRACADVIEAMFPGDEEMRFRLPYEMYDVSLLRRLLAAAHFDVVNIEKKRLPVDRVSARAIATGQIRGTPRSLLIERRGASLDEVVDKVTKALVADRRSGPLPRFRAGGHAGGAPGDVILFLSLFGGIKRAGTRCTVAIAGMSMPFSATELLAELPRLRRYARILTDDPERADRLVEETLLRSRQMQGESAFRIHPPHATPGAAALRQRGTDRAGHAARDTGARAFRGACEFECGPERKREASPLPDRGAQMLAQLRELPLEQREVLVLVAVERMSYADIAALLHMPVATVISRLSQAREALRSIPPNPLSAPKSAS